MWEEQNQDYLAPKLYLLRQLPRVDCSWRHMHRATGHNWHLQRRARRILKVFFHTPSSQSGFLFQGGSRYQVSHRGRSSPCIINLHRTRHPVQLRLCSAGPWPWPAWDQGQPCRLFTKVNKIYQYAVSELNVWIEVIPSPNTFGLGSRD